MSRTHVATERRNGYTKLVVMRPGPTRMAEIYDEEDGGGVVVFGTFAPDDVAALVEAAYELGKGEADA